MIKEIEAFCAPLGSVVAKREPILAPDSLQRMLHCAYDAVFAVVQGASHDLEIPPLTLALIPGAEPHYLGSTEPLFYLALARLLETDQQRIRRCARAACGRFFVRRKRALYCGKQCSQIEQVARYVERHNH